MQKSVHYQRNNRQCNISRTTLYLTHTFVLIATLISINMADKGFAAPSPLTTCFAEVEAVRGSFGSSGHSTANGQAKGWEFSVTDSIEVTALGVYDRYADGLGEAHEVRLWNSDGTLLRTVTVQAGTASPLSNYTRYEDITPITLSPAERYVVAASYPTSVDVYATAYTSEIGNEVVFRENRTSYSLTGFPYVVYSGSIPFWGGTFKYLAECTPTPTNTPTPTQTPTSTFTPTPNFTTTPTPYWKCLSENSRGVDFTEAYTHASKEGSVRGWKFITNEAIRLTSLGIYDRDADGLTESHTVSLYTENGELIKQVTIPSGTSSRLSGLFRFEDIDPIQLYAGQTCVVCAYYPDIGDGYTSYNPDLTTGNEITFIEDRFLNTGEDDFPQFSYELTNAYFGGNFEYVTEEECTPTPTPTATPTFTPTPTITPWPCEAEGGRLTFTGSHNLVGSTNTFHGWIFEVNQKMKIYALGAFDDNQNGNTEPHLVRLWDANTQEILREVTIQTGTTSVLDGYFRFENVDPIVLQTGNQYVVAACHPTNNDSYANQVSDYTHGSEFSFIEDRWWYNCDGFPSLSDNTTDSHFGGNFKYVIECTPSPTETQTPTMTDTPIPTDTPVPTDTATPEPTSSPTPMPTETPVPTMTPTMPPALSCTLYLQGFYSTSTGTQVDTNITVQFRIGPSPDTATTIVSSFAINLDNLGQSGMYYLDGLPEGSYYLVIEHYNHLPIITESSYSFVANSIVYLNLADELSVDYAPVYGINAMYQESDGFLSMFGANSDDNCFINVLDVMAWLNVNGSSCGDGIYNSIADFDANCFINVLDALVWVNANGSQCFAP